MISREASKTDFRAFKTLLSVLSGEIKIDELAKEDFNLDDFYVMAVNMRVTLNETLNVVGKCITYKELSGVEEEQAG